MPIWVTLLYFFSYLLLQEIINYLQEGELIGVSIDLKGQEFDCIL